MFKLPLRLESVPSWCTVLGNERLCLPRYQPNLARVEDLRMTKEDEIMVFLHERVFDPILKSPDAPQSLKQGVRLTIARMWERDAAGMIEFYYSAIVGTDRVSLLPLSFVRRDLFGSKRSWAIFANALPTSGSKNDGLQRNSAKVR